MRKAKFVTPYIKELNILTENPILSVSTNLDIDYKGDSSDSNITEAETRKFNFWH